MWKNYLMVGLRSMWRNRLYTAINATGLALGMACCLLLCLYVQHEYSYENFQQHADRLYRIDGRVFFYDDINSKANGIEVPVGGSISRRSAYQAMPLGPELGRSAPAVERFARVGSSPATVRMKGDAFKVRVTYTDSSFFEMFSFRLLAGQPEQMLRTQHDAVLTEAAAVKYFGTVQGAMGQTLVLDLFGTRKEFVVAGVVENRPTNTDMRYNDIIVRIDNSSSFAQGADEWNWSSTPCFVLLREGATPAQLETQLAQIVQEKIVKPQEAEARAAGKPVDGKKRFQYEGTPLKAMHLDGEVQWGNSIDPLYVKVMGGIAALVLLLASINYVVLALSRMLSRGKEVGIRVAVGAGRGQVFWQFLSETFVLTGSALLLSLLLVSVSLPSFNELAGRQLVFRPFEHLWLLGAIVGLLVLVSVLAGGYPAWYVSRFKTGNILKGRATSRVKPGSIRALVLVQLSLSVFLISCAVILFEQMDYVLNKDLGYNAEQVVVVELQSFKPKFVMTVGGADDTAGDEHPTLARMRAMMGRYPAVEEVAGTSISFGQGWSRYATEVDSLPGRQISHVVYRVDPHYVPALGLKLVAGRNFHPTPQADRQGVILNEAAVKALGWKPEEAIGRPLNWTGNKERLSTIVGVVADYHFQSLTAKIEPMLLHQETGLDQLNTALVRLKAGQTAAGLAQVQALYKAAAPGEPLEIRFLNEDLQKQYEEQLRWRAMLGTATLLATLIAVLGVFGLASVNAANRVREIGIRKVLGANVRQIVLLLNRELVVIVLVALVLAVPLSYYLMQRWLETFQYRIEPGWQQALEIAGVALLVAVIGVGYQSVRAGLSNPADSIRAD